MVSRAQLKDLSKVRLKESKALLQNGLCDGAHYIAGYVVELALKARICRILDMDPYPETGDFGRFFKKHSYDDLLKLAGLHRKFFSRCNTDNDFNLNWSLVNTWNETFRYSVIGTKKEQDVLDFLNALEDKQYGVYTWIKKSW